VHNLVGFFDGGKADCEHTRIDSGAREGDSAT
jgi:hypothetical protein